MIEVCEGQVMVGHTPTTPSATWPSRQKMADIGNGKPQLIAVAQIAPIEPVDGEHEKLMRRCRMRRNSGDHRKDRRRNQRLHPQNVTPTPT